MKTYMSKFKECLYLYWTFFKIGGLTFGGGLTMLPLLKHELVERREWISDNQLMDCYAIGQCTPGIIAVNTATFVGYIRQGVVGGISATLGMISPSIIIISLLASVISRYIQSPILGHILMGIRGVVCALMVNTVIIMIRKNVNNRFCIVVAIVAFCIAMFTSVPTVIIVIMAGMSGIILGRIRSDIVDE